MSSVTVTLEGTRLEADPLEARPLEAQPLEAQPLEADPRAAEELGTANLPVPKVGLVRRLWAAAARPGLRKAGMSVFDQALLSGTSFVTSILIGRTGGTEMLGLFALAWSVTLFVRGVQEQVVSAPYMIYCRKKTGRRLAGYAGSSLAHQLLLCLAGSACLLAAVVAMALRGGDAPLQPVLAVLIGVMPLVLLREFVRHLEFSHFRLFSSVLLDGAVAGLQIALLVGLALAGRLTATTAFAAMGVACLLPTAAWFLLSGVRFQIRPVKVLRDWKRNWTFAKWALASQLLGSATPYVMPWVVAISEGEAATGLFAAGSTLVGLANMFVIGLSNYLSPKAAEAYADGGLPRLKVVLWKTAALFTVTLGAFCVVAASAGSLLASSVYGSEFVAAGPVIAILSLSMWGNAMTITAGNGLWAMHRPAANFRADLASVFVTVALTVLCVPSFGIVGAAIAMLGGQFADAGIRAEILRRMMRDEARGGMSR